MMRHWELIDPMAKTPRQFRGGTAWERGVRWSVGGA